MGDSYIMYCVVCSVMIRLIVFVFLGLTISKHLLCGTGTGRVVVRTSQNMVSLQSTDMITGMMFTMFTILQCQHANNDEMDCSEI